MPELTTEELHDRLSALADRADGFDLPGAGGDPYPLVRRRSRGIRRRRALLAGGVAAVVAGALVATWLPLHGASGPHHQAPADGRPLPWSAPDMEVPATTPAVLPTLGAVGVAEKVVSSCPSGCPVYLKVSPPAAAGAEPGPSVWYTLPAQPGSRSIQRVSISPDGHWLWYHQNGRGVLRELTGDRQFLEANDAEMIGWQPYSSLTVGKTPGLLSTRTSRWALVQLPGGRAVLRVDLGENLAERKDVSFLLPSPDRSWPLGVLSSGDLVIGTADHEPADGIGSMTIRLIDPVSGKERQRFPVPSAVTWYSSGNGADTPHPSRVFIGLDGHRTNGQILDDRAIFTDPHGRGERIRIVDLRTGSSRGIDLDAQLAKQLRRGDLHPQAGTTVRWAPLGFGQQGPSFSFARLASSGGVDVFQLDAPVGGFVMTNPYKGAGTLLPGNPPPRN